MTNAEASMSLDIEQSLKQARKLILLQKEEEARLLLLEILKQDANNRAALLMLGGSYFSIEKYSEAEMAFERLILIDPCNGRYSIALFNILWKLGRQEEALEEIKRFLENADSVTEKETIDQYMKITQNLSNQ